LKSPRSNSAMDQMKEALLLIVSWLKAGLQFRNAILGVPQR